MMTLRNLSRLTLTLCVTATVGAANADGLGDAIHSCRGAPSAVDKVAACTFVIARVSDDGALLKAYNRRGLANVELGRYPEAVRDFSAVIRLNPKVAGYYDNRQNAFRQLGRFDEALSDANAAVRLAPSYTFVFRSRAIVYDDMGRQDLAISDYTHAIALDVNDASLRGDRAKLYAKIGRDGDAFVDLSNAIALDPSNVGLLRDRAFLFVKSGNVAAAQSDLVEYLTRQPGDVEAAKALATLQASQAKPVIATPSAPVAPPADPYQRQADALDAKKKLVADAVAQHESCLMDSLATITPYSAESAPTLVDVAIDKCSKFAERRIAIGVGAYDMTREEAKAVVDRKIAEIRTKLITAVVTSRAEAARGAAGADQDPAKTDAPTTSQGVPKAQPL